MEPGQSKGQVNRERPVEAGVATRSSKLRVCRFPCFVECIYSSNTTVVLLFGNWLYLIPASKALSCSFFFS